MENVMVVFSSTDIQEEIVDFALDQARKKGAKLIILDVRDRELSEKVGDITENVGFMGEKVVGNLKKEISHGRCDIIYQRLSIIKDKALEMGIPYKIVVERGPFERNVLKVAKDLKVKTVITYNVENLVGKGDFKVITP